MVGAFRQTFATGPSALLDGACSHDKVSRFLSHREHSSKDLWKEVKPEVRKIESEEGVLIADDSIQEKPYSDANNTRKEKRKNEFTKNEYMRKMLSICQNNQLKHRYVLSDNMSIYSGFKLECLSLKHGLNHVALKSKLYISPLKQAFDEVTSLKACIA